MSLVSSVNWSIVFCDFTASSCASIFVSIASSRIFSVSGLFAGSGLSVAFSTAISWSYYGLKAWTFLFGEGKVKEVCYKVIFCLFTILGSILSLKQVVGFSDSMIFAMCLPNIIGLYMLSPVVREELNRFMVKIKSFKKL